MDVHDVLGELVCLPRPFDACALVATDRAHQVNHALVDCHGRVGLQLGPAVVATACHVSIVSYGSNSTNRC